MSLNDKKKILHTFDYQYGLPAMNPHMINTSVVSCNARLERTVSGIYVTFLDQLRV